MWNKIKLWFSKRSDLIFWLEIETHNTNNYKQLLDEVRIKSGCKEGDNIVEHIGNMRKNLVYKVSQERAAEILAIKPFETKKEMGATNYKDYLAEAESIYRMRPWKDIIKTFQQEQLKYIMLNTDGGDVGLQQQLVCRGGIIFADYAEKEMNKLHVSHLEVITGNKELSDEEKYSIFN